MNIQFSNQGLLKFSLWMVGLMFTLPFTIGYHTIPIPSFYNEMVAFILGLLALLILCVRESWRDLATPNSVFFLLAFSLIPIVQSALGLIPIQSQAIIFVCYISLAAGLMCLGALHQKQLSPTVVVGTLAKIFVAGAWFNVAYVAMQMLQKLGYIEPSFFLAASFGAIAQANHFTDFISIAIAALFYLQFGGEHANSLIKQSIITRRLKFAHFILAQVFFVGLLAISTSRSSWLYLVVMLIFAVYHDLNKFHVMHHSHNSGVQSTRHQNSLFTSLKKAFSTPLVHWAIFLFPLFALMQVLLNWVAGDFVLTAAKRFSEFSDPHVVGGLKMRLLMWQQTIHYFFAHPWWGIGLQQSRAITFADPSVQYVIAGGSGAYEHPHNLLVQLLSETGVIGTLLLLSPLWAWIRSMLAPSNTDADWWIHCVLAILFIHAMLEYPLSYIYFLGLLAYLIGYQHRTRLLLPAFSKKILHGLITLGVAFGLLCAAHTTFAYHKLDHWIRLLGAKQFNAQDMDGFYTTVSWMNSKSILNAYSYPMFLLAIEFLPIENSAKQAINEVSLKVLPMPKSAYLQVVYLLQQQQIKQAQHAMLLAVKAFPKDYQDRLKSVPTALKPSYESLYQHAIQTLKIKPIP